VTATTAVRFHLLVMPDRMHRGASKCRSSRFAEERRSRPESPRFPDSDCAAPWDPAFGARVARLERATRQSTRMRRSWTAVRDTDAFCCWNRPRHGGHRHRSLGAARRVRVGHSAPATTSPTEEDASGAPAPVVPMCLMDDPRWGDHGLSGARPAARRRSYQELQSVPCRCRLEVGAMTVRST